MPDNLLSKQQAAELAGVSVRSLERYTSKGRIPVGYKTTARGKEAVYTTEAVERLRAELEAERAAVVVPAPQQPVRQDPPTALARVDELRPFLAQLVEAIAARAPAQTQEGPQRGALSPGEKLALTIPEAAQLVGASDRRIRAAIHAGELHAIKDTLGRGWRIRRRDLEEWLSSL